MTNGMPSISSRTCSGVPLRLNQVRDERSRSEFAGVVQGLIDAESVRLLTPVDDAGDADRLYVFNISSAPRAFLRGVWARARLPKSCGAPGSGRWARRFRP